MMMWLYDCKCVFNSLYQIHKKKRGVELQEVLWRQTQSQLKNLILKDKDTTKHHSAGEDGD